MAQARTRLANAIQRFLVEETRLGIPALIHDECCSGFLANAATNFPQITGLASTWEPALVAAMTQIIRRQMRAVGVVNNRQLAAQFFDKPVGVLAPGAYADLILLDYHPTTPLSAANLPWHILFGVSGGHVHSTIAHGRVLMRAHELLTLDEAAIAAASRAAAAATWDRNWKRF